jgi:hypothetical protein
MLFAAVTCFVMTLFVLRLVGEHEIRSGLLTYGLFTGAAAVGLWLERRWGHALGLVVALGNAGLGTLALLAVIISREGPVLGPALLLVGSIVLSYLLSRPVYSFPQDRADAPPL